MFRNVGAHDCWLAPTFFPENVIHYCIETYPRVHVRIRRVRSNSIVHPQGMSDSTIEV
jgi:transposase-like protein